MCLNMLLALGHVWRAPEMGSPAFTSGRAWWRRLPSHLDYNSMSFEQARASVSSMEAIEGFPRTVSTASLAAQVTHPEAAAAMLQALDSFHCLADRENPTSDAVHKAAAVLRHAVERG